MNVTAALGDPRVIRLSQGPIRIYERGAGRPLVFVQGLFANAAAWRKVVPLLAGSYRCITADWPFGGHHFPMSPQADLTPIGIAHTVADVIDHLGLSEATLIGNDGGGMLSQLVVAHRPDRIAGLVLTLCDAYENFPPPQFDYLCRLARLRGIEPPAARALRIRSLRNWCAKSRYGFGSLSHHPIDADLLEHYLHGVVTDRGILRDSLALLRAVDNRYTLEAAQQFPTITMPVLIAWASDDDVFPIRHGRRLARDFPNARFETIPHSRTWVAEDRPEHLADMIERFTNSRDDGAEGWIDR